MKKKTGVVLSSAAAIAVCASIMAGSTYALFTSESKTDISVSSGSVNVVATVNEDSLKTKQLYDTEWTAGDSGLFGGSVELKAGLINVENLAAGDAVSFTIDVENVGTVNAKYRTVIKSETELGELAVTIDGESVTYGAATAYGAWADIAVGETINGLEVVMELPETAVEQNAEYSLTYKVEAVQGNAAVSNIEQGVELNVTYNPDFVANGNDAAKRIECANELLAAKDSYATLAEAKKVITSLFNTSGNYSGTYFSPEYGYNVSYSSAGPLYIYYTERATEANARPISKIEYIIHGTVDAGATSLALDTGVNETPTEEVILRGWGSDAKLENVNGLSAFVSGGHSVGFVTEGSFTVSNIEFNETDKMVIGAGFPNHANNFDNDNITYWKADLNILNCKFNSQLYNYMHYEEEIQPNVNVNVKDCTFVCSENCSQAYAYFIQGFATNVVFEGNTVSGYPRGINVQVQLANRCDVVIRSNTFGNNTAANKNLIQLTTASTFLVEGNVIENAIGNAITFHELLVNMPLESIIIRNNTVNAKYFIYNEAGDIADKVTIEGNNGNIEKSGLQNSGSSEAESPFLLK